MSVKKALTPTDRADIAWRRWAQTHEFSTLERCDRLEHVEFAFKAGFAFAVDMAARGTTTFIPGTAEVISIPRQEPENG